MGSAHSRVEILESLDGTEGASLVLVDEIAAGTDPVQGAALGRALLGALLERGAVVVTTTHYPELKVLSTTDDRFRTAQVGFDPKEGKPTYHLEMDRAGGSHALDVAAQVGLEASILDRARSYLDPGAASLEALLSRLEGEVQAARAARDAAEADRRQGESELSALQTERDELLRRSRDLERELRAEFNAEVEGYRATVRGALKQMEEAQSVEAAERARQRIHEGASAIEARLGQGSPLPVGDRVDPSTVQAGDWLRVGSLGRDVTVLSGPDGKGRWLMDAGGLKIQVPGKDLERARSPAPSRSPKQGKTEKGGGKKGKTAGRGRESSRTPAVPGRLEDPSTAFRSEEATLDLRGQLVDDALELVDRFLDESAVSGRSFAFLLHGHGTGALKKAVRAHLRGSPYVSRWEAGTRGQGGDGITVVVVQTV